VPGAVEDLRVVWSTAKRISVAWDAASGTVSGYRLARNGVVVGTTARLRWRFARLACGQTYTLSVTPFNSIGAGPSSAISASTLSCRRREGDKLRDESETEAAEES
jgi:hypothetical protein